MSDMVDIDAMCDIVRGIEKIKYEESFFSIEKMAIGHKQVYSIYPSGKIERRSYKDNLRKLHAKEIIEIPPEKVLEYYTKVINCMKNASMVSQYVDDCGAKMTISYWGGEIVLPRGLESQDGNISSITYEFLSAEHIYQWG